VVKPNAKKKKTDEEAEAQKLGTNAKKWGEPLILAGWTCLPNVVFQNQKELDLSPTDINILLHLLSYWWEPGSLPHPSKVTIAGQMDMDPRSVQRRIAAMEQKGLIARVGRNGPSRGTQSNFYRFDGLIEKATELAKSALKKREERGNKKAPAAAETGEAA